MLRHIVVVMGMIAAAVSAPAIGAPLPTALRKVAVPADLQIAGWNHMLGRLREKLPMYRVCRDNPRRCPNEQIAAWQAFLLRLRSATPVQKLDAINRFANKVSYARDNAKSADSWATPDESLEGGADCEDYTILKYFSLRELGFAAKQMRITVMAATERIPAHAILAVDIGGLTFYADNLDSELSTSFKYDDQALLYYINEQESRMYVTPGSIVVTANGS